MLAVVAVRQWSPLVVLAACVVSLLGFLAFLAIDDGTVGRELGGWAVALAIGAWGVRRRARVFWAIPLGWLVVGLVAAV